MAPSNEPMRVRTGETCMFCDIEICWLPAVGQYQHVPPPGQFYGYFKCRGDASGLHHWARPKRWKWWQVRWPPPVIDRGEG